MRAWYIRGHAGAKGRMERGGKAVGAAVMSYPRKIVREKR
jgi:hypothetical protein